MRKFLACSTIVMVTLVGPVAMAAEWINPIPPENNIPPPPSPGSRIEKEEIGEILRTQAAATPERLALARQDNDIENATIFAGVIGPEWDLNRLPKTKFLIDQIMTVDRSESSSSQKYFRRSRPWIVEPKVQTCAPHESGPAANSYPSGHTMLGYELGVVLASLMPNKAKAILARSEQYGESRIVCGFHFRSDVTAGRRFGTVIAVEMMKNPVFLVWFKEAQAELKAAGPARVISAANAQTPPAQEFVGLPPDPKPIGMPPDPKWIGLPTTPQSVIQPPTSEAAPPPSAPKPIVQSPTPDARPNDMLPPPRVVEIPLPSSFPAEAIWGSTGRDSSGHIWVGVSTRGYGPSAHLLEYAPNTGKFRDRGDVVSELKHAGVWRDGESQIKIHTKIFQAEDGYLYFASFDEEGESVSRAIKPKWGGHLWRLKPNSDHWEHLRAVPEGMVALAGYGNWIYALGYWDQVLYQYDTRKGTWRSVTVGSVRGHVSRNIVVDLHGHVFVPRAREWRPEEVAAHPMELFSAELVEFDTNLKQVGTTRLDNYIDPHAGRDSHGIIGLAYLANGSIVVSTHLGYLYRITPANSGASKVEGLGWIHPNGPSYAASLFPVDGERYLAAVTTVEGAPPQWVVYDLRTRQGRARPLPLEVQDPLLYGTSTRDDNGRFYVVGWQKNFPHGHKPVMLQIDSRH